MTCGATSLVLSSPIPFCTTRCGGAGAARKLYFEFSHIAAGTTTNPGSLNRIQPRLPQSRCRVPLGALGRRWQERH